MISRNKKAKRINQFRSKIGILGYGEVGQAIAKFYNAESDISKKIRYQNPRIKDLKRDNGLEGVEILNVCIPWSNNFIKILSREIKRIKPKLVIIHSTVAVGTTKKINDSLPRACRGVVHSPIRGVHPHLYKGIKIFVKYIGADSKKAGEMAKRHLESLGIKTKIFYPSKTTELGKLFDTSYYGLCIAWHGEMKKICEKEGIKFEEAVTDFNQTYNKGYKRLGMSHVVRPVLYPPKNGIGGHCIRQNAEILKKYHKSDALNLILKYKPKT